MANNWMRLLANAGGIMGTQRREKKPPKWGTPPFVADYDDEDETPVPATRPRRVQTEPVPEVDPSQITMFGDRPRIVPEQLPPTMGTADAERSPMSADAPQPRRRSMEGDMTALQEALQAEMDRPIENRKTKGWFGKLKRGFGKFARSMEQGGSLVGSIMNAADPTWDERQNKQNNINQMLAQYTTLNNVRKAEQDRETEDAQIEDLRMKPILAAMQQRQVATKALNEMDWYDPKNPAHRQAAQTAGLNPDTVPARDSRKREREVRAGVTYERNPNTGAWEQSGLAADESQKIVDYKVTVNGETRTYRIPQKDAARFETEQAAAGVKFQRDMTMKEFDRETQRQLQEIKRQMDAEEREWKAAQDSLKYAQDEASKLAAQQRVDASVQRTMELQKKLGLLTAP